MRNMSLSAVNFNTTLESIDLKGPKGHAVHSHVKSTKVIKQYMHDHGLFRHLEKPS